jgi:hypothetical protein
MIDTLHTLSVRIRFAAVTYTHLPDPEVARSHVFESRCPGLDLFFEGLDILQFVNMDNKCRVGLIAKNPTCYVEYIRHDRPGSVAARVGTGNFVKEGEKDWCIPDAPKTGLIY